MTDEGIRSTNNDAAHCKRWCVERGYYHDPFIKHFVPHTTSKSPEISRGYYLRTQSVWLGVKNFVRSYGRKCQVINVGAGSDTLFWNLSAEGLQPERFVELDFVQIVMKKIRVITKKNELLSVLKHDTVTREGQQSHDDARDSDKSSCHVTKTTINSPHYHLLSLDLRAEDSLTDITATCQLDTSLPTLVFAECVLCYLPPQSSHNLMSWTSRTFSNSVFLNYEPCNMDDRFGSIMVDNMRSRDCELPGILACPRVADQEARFLAAGFSRGAALDMNEVMRLLPSEGVARMSKLEFFDELEILTQLLEHYCLAWGSQGTCAGIVFSD